MKIIGINLQNTKTHFNHNKSISVPIFKQPFDTINFSAKPKQANLTAEGKNIVKASHGIIAESQKIQATAKEFQNKSSLIQQQAESYLKEANQEWEEITNVLNYAKQNKTRALVDPFSQTDLFFDINENKETITLHEYKNDKLTRKIIQRPSITTITTYGETITRKIFDTESGELSKYDENITHIGNASKIEHSFMFDGNALKRYSHNKTQTAENLRTQITYDFENGSLIKTATETFATNSGYSSSEEEFIFGNNKLIKYLKSPQQDTNQYATSEEEFEFDGRKLTYAKNKNDIFDIILTADTIYQIDNSKIKRAIISLSQGQNTKTIDKLFTFDKHEKPQYCYLVYQSDVEEENDENFSYDGMVWLGGKKN